MAKKVKISSSLYGLHNLVTQGSIPHPTTSPFATLNMRENEKERLIEEQERMRRKNRQVNTRLKIIHQEMKRLLKVATGKEWATIKGFNPGDSKKEGKNSTVLEY